MFEKKLFKEGKVRPLLAYSITAFYLKPRGIFFTHINYFATKTAKVKVSDVV